ANEELQSANEEVQSANEELQSINEELETSKEEIQSSNEELATVNDELKESNLELSQTNNDLVNLLVSVQMPIVMLGRDLRIRRFTPTAERLLNLLPTDVGRAIGDVKLGLNVDDFEDMLAEVVDTVSVKEQLVQDRQGHWYSLRVHPYKTLENKIDGAVLVLVDVDELKRAEQALRESEGRFLLLADNAPVLIWMNGPEGRRYVNKAYLDFLQVREADVQGYDWAKFIHPDDRDAYMSIYREKMAVREPFEIQFRFRRADGEYRWMKSVGVPRSTPSGEFLGYIGCKVDITDLKEAERALRETDRSKNDFLAVLAHELRTPLAAMRNAIQVVAREEADETAAAARAKSVIERQTAQMVRMVDDLLDLSRFARGTFQLRKRRMNLLDSLGHAIDATAYERATNEQTLTLTAPDHPIMLRADPARLQQVFANLLSNAARYTPKNGRVWVTVEEAKAPRRARGDAAAASVVVRVRDDGIGIEPRMLPHVFGLFAQVDHAAGRGSGLGVGLNLARRLVELHDGEITAYSAGKDRGSEFVVRLPMDPTPAARAADGAAAADRRTSRTAPPLRVLVVDDNPDAADMLAALLELSGQQVLSANDGEQAIELAKRFKPQLALLDISMPDMDGRELARRLRATPEIQPVVVVAVTGFSPHEAMFNSSRSDFDELITKPLEQEALLALLARARRTIGP
ncbi:MAG TPA: ATP-binding protein, partial [Dokdonella sp.]